MTTTWKRIGGALVLASAWTLGGATLMTLPGCEDNNAEDLGDALDDAGDAVGDAVDDAADNVEDATN